MFFGFNTSALNLPQSNIENQFDLPDNSPKFSALQTYFCAGAMLGSLAAGLTVLLFLKKNPKYKCKKKIKNKNKNKMVLQDLSAIKLDVKLCY